MSKKRLQVDLSEDAYSRLSTAADAEGRTTSEFVRRALNIEDYLRQTKDQGGKVLVVDKDGTERELIVSP